MAASKLMEINGRFWGSLQLAIDAGVNFPRLAVDIALEQASPIDTYRVGVRSRWFWGDVDAMISLLLRSRATSQLARSPSGSLANAAELPETVAAADAI